MMRSFFNTGVTFLAMPLFLLVGCRIPALAQNSDSAKPRKAPTASGTTFRHSAGWSFNAPATWTVQKNNAEQFKLIPAGADAAQEGYGLGYTPGPKIDDVRGTAFARVMDDEIKRLLPFLHRSGEPQMLTIPFGPAAVIIWDGTTPDGTAVRARTYTAPFADGAIILLAFGAPEKMDRRNTDLRQVFVSLRRVALPKEDTESILAKTWRKRLSGNKLTHLESYNGGSSGGYSARTDLVLYPDGRLTFSGDSSVSITVDNGGGNNSGRKKGTGKWRIISRGTTAILAVTADGHPTEFFLLASDGAKTLLNGKRWFVTAP